MSEWYVESTNEESERDADDSDSVISYNSVDLVNHQIELDEDNDEELRKIMNTVNAEISELADSVGGNVNRNEIACSSADSGSKTNNSQATSLKSQPKPAPISQRRRSERISALKQNADENTKTNKRRTKQQRLKQTKAELTEIQRTKKNKTNSKSSVDVTKNQSDSEKQVVSVSGKRKISDTQSNERLKTILSAAVLKCFTDFRSQIQLQSECQPLADDSSSDPTNTNSKEIRFSAKCTICGERKQFQKGSVWNLKCHLEKKHAETFSKLIDEENNEIARKRPRLQSTDIETALVKFIVKDRLPISKLDSIHLNDLISACLNKGRSSSGSELESMFCKRTGNYCSRQKGTVKIKALAHDHRQRLKEKFKEIKYFSATTDIWSRSNRSFMAISVHYFDCSLDKCAEPVLKTDFIACEYFNGRHTQDRVAEKLSAIFERFGIKEKVYFVTTDGAGEYVAAFKYYGDNYESIHLKCETDIDITSISGTTATMAGPSIVANDATTCAPIVTTASPGQSLGGKQEEMMTDTDFDSDLFMYKGDPPKKVDNDSFVLHNFDEILSLAPDPRDILGKMNRIDCSAHKTDKLGSIDAATAKTDDSDYASIYTQVFDKLNRIWGLKESRISAEIFKQITGKSLIGPHRIRWLKWFEAVNNILSIGEDKLEQACAQLRIDPLESSEYAFLREYRDVMALVATALETLEANCYTFGIYLPTLFGLQYQLQRLITRLSTENSRSYSINIVDDEGNIKTVSSNCLPLAYAIKRGFDNRFGELIDPYNMNGKSVPLFVAMMSNPTFKLNFMCLPSISEELFKHLKEMLVSAAIDMYKDENQIRTDDNCGHLNSISFPSAIQLDADDSNPNSSMLNRSKLLVEFDVSESIGMGLNRYCIREEITREVDSYFGTKPSLNIEAGLRSHPNIRRLFLKFNCIRSSEAICERMFSYAGMILTDKRGNLTPSLFEDLLVLHMNDWFHDNERTATATNNVQ